MRTRHRTLIASAAIGLTAVALVGCTADVMRPEVDVQRTSAVSMPSPSLVAPPIDPDVSQPYDIDPGIDIGTPGMSDTEYDQSPSQDFERPDGVYSEPPGREAAIGNQSFPPRPPSPAISQPEIAPQVEPERRFSLLPRTPRVESGLPQDEVDCRRQLKRIGATFRDLPPISNGGSCGIAHPVELSKLSGNITIKPAATLTCKMALTFARWTKHELAPAARLRYLTGVKTIYNASSYSCRRIAGSRSMSEHSKGNAIDISRIELDSGRRIGVEKKGLFSFREKGLLNNVRGDACSYFSTVLGPGYNYDHRDHFHFDIATRRGGRVSCN